MSTDTNAHRRGVLAQCARDFFELGPGGWHRKWWERRPGRLYEFLVIHPDTVLLSKNQWRIVSGYVGLTRQAAVKRHDEHLYGSTYGGKVQAPKLWGDTVWAHREIYSRARVTGFWLHRRERIETHHRKPIYPVVHNLGNPDRVTKAKQVEQRLQRDELRERGVWVYSYQPPVLVARGAELGWKKRKDGTAQWYGTALTDY